MKIFAQKSIGNVTVFAALSFAQFTLAQSYPHKPQMIFAPPPEARGAASGKFGNFKGLLDQIEMSPEATECQASFKYTEKFRDEGPKESSREKMPIGYYRGMLMSFAQNVCLKDDPGKGVRGDPKTAMISPTSSANDTLQKYAGDKGLLGGPGMTLSEKNEKHLINSFSLLMTLGMLESSGKINEGVDKNAKSGRGAEEIEAGLFQFSANSRGFVDTSRFGAYNTLLEQFRAKPEKCLKEVFSETDKASPQVPSPPQLPATGDNAENFQVVMKECPAFAAAFGAILIRKTDQHNGPFKRKEAEPKIACTKNLEKMYDLIKSKPNVCDSL